MNIEISTGSVSVPSATCKACQLEFRPQPVTTLDYEYRIHDVGQYAQCSHCKTIIQYPMPDDRTLGSYYPQTYHSQTSEGIIVQIRHALRLRSLKSFLSSDAVVLDYGCGNGSFLHYLVEHVSGLRCFGYEISENAHIRTDETNAVTLIYGDLSYLLENIPPCSLISMNHVIEHLPDPGETILRLQDKLVDGGYLEGQTPAANSLEHRVFKQYWSGYHAPRHTVVFSESGLSSFLGQMGYSEIRIKSAFNPACSAISLASFFLRARPDGIPRSSIFWLFWLLFACLLAPIDLLSSQSGVMNFSARKNGS